MKLKLNEAYDVEPCYYNAVEILRSLSIKEPYEALYVLQRDYNTGFSHATVFAATEYLKCQTATTG
jgi:hypothetical protein